MDIFFRNTLYVIYLILITSCSSFSLSSLGSSFLHSSRSLIFVFLKRHWCSIIDTLTTYISNSVKGGVGNYPNLVQFRGHAVVFLCQRFIVTDKILYLYTSTFWPLLAPVIPPFFSLHALNKILFTKLLSNKCSEVLKTRRFLAYNRIPRTLYPK